jgi:hydroxyacylglutathione hydrolase
MEPTARQLQESLHNRLTPFADFLQILPGHGAGSACGKALGAVPTATLGYEQRFNGALKGSVATMESKAAGFDNSMN